MTWQVASGPQSASAVTVHTWVFTQVPEIAPPEALIVRVASQLSLTLPAAAMAIAELGNVAGLQPRFIGADGQPANTGTWVSSVQVNGSVSNARNFGWGSDGDGHFTNPYALNTSYIPGIKDKTNGFADLILVAFAKAPCKGNVTDIKHLVIDPCTNVPESVKNALRLEINPNPANGFVNCTIFGLREKALLTLIGMDGITHASFMVEPNGEKMTKLLDIEGYSKGVYIIRLKTVVQVLTEKLVVR